MSTSVLVLQELFERADARFLPELLRATGPDRGLVERWLEDGRPWARARLLEYVDDGCDRAGHRRIVKHLLRNAEKRADVELLAHLAAAFDRLIAHRLATRTRWDRHTSSMVTGVVRRLSTRVPFRLGHDDTRRPEDARFSIVTRRYLQRRAVRALRALGEKGADPVLFRRAAVATLALYTDAHLADAARILDARALLELCFHGSPALRRMSHRIDVRADHTLGELTAAPLRASHWASADADTDLLRLVAAAPALLVRRFAAGLLAGRSLDVRALAPLLGSVHDDVQELAVALLPLARVDGIDAAGWAALLGVAGALCADAVVARARAVLSTQSLDAQAWLRLAKSRAAPVAELAAVHLEDAPIAVLLEALDAEVPAVRVALGARAVRILEQSGAPEQVRQLVDARFADVRALGLRLLADVRFRDDTGLWTALSESPFADVRAFLLSHLAERGARMPASSLPRVWASALLSIHGGGRGKRTALLQLAQHAIDAVDEDARGRALELVAVALRSTRGPEVDAALAALARAAVARPALAAQVRTRFPALAIHVSDAVEVQA